MRSHYLTPLFAPRNIAIIGASDTPGSLGQSVFANLLAGNFKGKLFPVNLHHTVIGGKPAVKNINEISEPIDLAVVTTPMRALPDIVKACVKKGVKALLLGKELSENDEHEREFLIKGIRLAKKHGLRVLGPNLLGLMRPGIGLNASNYSGVVRPGNLALVSQSSALCAAMLDWADGREIGFSSVIPVGENLDVEFGEILDYLVNDRSTQAILLHVQHIHNARQLMSALRAAARSKPLVIIKSGNYEEKHQEGLTQASQWLDSSEVFNAALARAGVLRVSNIDQLFTAVQVLAADYRVNGRRLAIITNGIGPGVLAADSAYSLGVELASLQPQTYDLLSNAMPRNWKASNPVDIFGDASPLRFRTAAKACLDDQNVDGVLVIFTPQHGTDHLITAQMMVGLQKESKKPLLLSWLGEAKVAQSRELFRKAHCAYFRVPESAIGVFNSLAAYHENQQLLLQTPGPLEGVRSEPDLKRAQILVDAALKKRRPILSEAASKALLAAFNIPVNPTELARDADEAVRLAEQFGYPVVLKIDSPDIVYKSDVGGVELNVNNEAMLRERFAAILQRTASTLPNARLNGISVQPMLRKRNAREVMVSMSYDKTFGPVMTFGSGGIDVEIVQDRALALPPLNEFLADNMIARTRISRALGEFKHQPPVNKEALRDVLLRVSELVCEMPEIRELDINPLIVDDEGVLALDARIVVRKAQHDSRRYSHMAIMPYPMHMQHCVILRDGSKVLIRPVRPEDAQMQQEFVRNLSEESRYNRYMSSIKQLSQSMLVRFTQLDYDREMALAMVLEQDGSEEMLGVARFVTDPDFAECEFALEVADKWQGRGIGTVLMEALFDAAREQGLKVMNGEVLAANKGMLKLMRKLGFEIEKHPEDSSLTIVRKALVEEPPALNTTPGNA